MKNNIKKALDSDCRRRGSYSLCYFLPIVGYDDEYIYAAESVGIYANEKGDHYNRKIKTDTFKELWKTDGHNHNVAIRVVRK